MAQPRMVVVPVCRAMFRRLAGDVKP
jgi:hypothetical protein